jgi:Beta-galactosidase trimerisation domain
VIDDFLSYDGGNQWDMHRSFAKPDAMIGFWTGYGSHGLAVQNGIWAAAVHNVLYPNVFWMYSFLNPDLTYSQSARDMGVAFKSLKFEGIGKLLMESGRQQDGIAIHYSMPSVHGASILGYHERNEEDEDQAQKKTGLSFPANRDGWVHLVKDLGMQFDFLSSEQVEKGELTNRRYKVLILPLSLALSQDEAKAIEAFIQAGGLVIADAAAGIMDQHCAWQQKGLLNELFGITAVASDKRSLKSTDDDHGGIVTVTDEGARWGLKANDLRGTIAAEPDIKAAGGTALVRIGNTDAVIARRVGKGWALYLNTLLDSYAQQRAEKFGGGKYRSLVNAILARAGVQPTVEVLSADGKRLAQAQIARYRFGDAEIIAVVKDNVAVERMIGQDGVTIYNDTALGKVARQEITIKLPRKLYVTDVRSGRRLGYTDVVHSSVLVGDAVVLALNSNENTITLRGPAVASLGEHVGFTIAVSRPGRSLISCHVFAPDGSMLPAYASNMLLDHATRSFVLPSALNDPSGTYTIRATDVVTGATGETKIILK